MVVAPIKNVKFIGNNIPALAVSAVVSNKLDATVDGEIPDRPAVNLLAAVVRSTFRPERLGKLTEPDSALRAELAPPVREEVRDATFGRPPVIEDNAEVADVNPSTDGNLEVSDPAACDSSPPTAVDA